ncbi:MAG: reverse transcriptase domain-containing protein [Sedimenticola sp.]
MFQKASAQVKTEIEHGNYVICGKAPKIISPMAAIPKPDGGVRLIHDCSRPTGRAVNDFCTTDWHHTFARVDDAAALMTEGCYFAKVDLKSAYRSVGISKRSQSVTGFKWDFNGKTVYLKDTKLPFGAKLSPGIFHRLTQAVKRMMARKGYDLIVVYLDDFLIISKSQDQCEEALMCLIQLLRKLGFAIHWGKVVGPTTTITFLGIELDSVSMQLRLPKQKLESMKQELHQFMSHKRATKRQIQSIAGRLSWAAGVVKGGRVFLRRIFNKIRTLKHGSHRTLLTVDIRQDLIWWSSFLETFNGKSTLLDRIPIECVFTDACDEAAGGSFGTDWFYCNWEIDWPQARGLHINEKEVLAVVIAARRWADSWGNKKIIIYSDNSVTVASINKGTSRNATVMQCLREFFWLSAKHNFHLTAKHIPGVQNFVADSASRLHSPGHLQRLAPYIAPNPLVWHMSLGSLTFLLDRFKSWRTQRIRTSPGWNTSSYVSQPGPRSGDIS